MCFQISFLLPVDTVPGRLGFLLTLFLCMINILNSRAANSPKSGVNANIIIQWILSCSLFIILATLEYSPILCYKKYKRPSLTEKMKQEQRIEKLSKLLDKLMLLIFPLGFFIFSAVLVWFSSTSQM